MTSEERGCPMAAAISSPASSEGPGSPDPPDTCHRLSLTVSVLAGVKRCGVWPDVALRGDAWGCPSGRGQNLFCLAVCYLPCKFWTRLRGPLNPCSGPRECWGAVQRMQRRGDVRSVWGHSPGGDTGEEGGPKGSCLSRTPRPPSSLADPRCVSGPSSLGCKSPPSVWE